MLPVTRKLVIAAPIEQVWTALTDQPTIQAWLGGHSRVRLDLRVGGFYAFFDGEISGLYTRIEPPQRLTYTWRIAVWPRDWPDSLVEWELTPAGQGTQVTLTQQPFPTTQERESHEEKWDVYLLDPMKAWLEAHHSP